MAESKGLWFLLGVSVGVLAGVLYAPQAGEQTRELLGRKADEGRDYVQRKTGDLRGQVSNWREQAGGLREQARDQVNDVRDQAVQFADRGKQAVTRQIDQFQAAVEAGKQAYRESAGIGGGAKKEAERPDREAGEASSTRL